MNTRRAARWLRAGTALLAAVWASAGYGQQTMLPASAIPKWKDPVPRLLVQGGTIDTHYGYDSGGGPGQLTLRMCEVRANVLPTGTFSPGVKPETWVWTYVAGECPSNTVDTYIGPAIVARRGTPTQITYVNELGDAASTNVLAYKYSTDQTLHWANPNFLDCMPGEGMTYPAFGSDCSLNYPGSIPAVAHLHGGEVPAEVDGSPDSWFTSGGQRGPKYYTKTVEGLGANAAVYTYPNVQESAPLWFHDHTLGATRLNVYAGLAGAYYLTDPSQPGPVNPLPPVEELIPLAIQDRMFDVNGQLFFTAGMNGGFVPPSAGWALNPAHPYWNPEFVGDVIAVNGKVWPRLDLQAKRYRFLFLNGSNARTYELFLTNPATKVNGPPLWVIGNDGGLLDAPALIDPNAAKPNPTKLVIMPGERYEVIVDFTAHAGQTLLLRNTAKTPYPGGATPNGATVGQILQLGIGAAVPDASYDPAKDGALRPPMQRLVAAGAVTPAVKPDLVRQLTLNEVMGMPMPATNPINGQDTNYPGGPLEILVNNTKWSGMSANGMRADFTPRPDSGDPLLYTEVPDEGAVEVWEIVNLTADAHPIHLHLVQFQILSRQAFDVGKYTAAYNLAFPGACTPKDPLTGYCPGYGPPLDYQPQTFTRTYPVAPNAPVPIVGGNPDVSLFLKSMPQPAAPQERGWKDTVQAPPGMVTRLMVRWGPTDTPTTEPARFAFDPSGDGTYNYVWHCHIIDHEDNEMMRPDFVTPASDAGTRAFVKGTDLTSY